MDNKINQANTNNTSFHGIKPKTGEVKTMEENIKKMIKDILSRAEREVPEYGDFAPVFEEFKNTEKKLLATDFMMKIYHVADEATKKKRGLELVAYKLPSPYKAAKVLETGTKEEILKKLQENDLYKEIDTILRSLSKRFEEVSY